MTPALVGVAKTHLVLGKHSGRAALRHRLEQLGFSLTREELQAGIEAYRKQRGRPAGSDKGSTTIRFDREVLAAFRAAGPGWQTRINAAPRDWLKNRSPA